MLFKKIFETHATKYLKNPKVSKRLKNIIGLILRCRTEKMGKRRHICKRCGYKKYTFCSCRNRHCPFCQTFCKEKWINARVTEMINCQYFHVVFTLPQQINDIAKEYINRTIIYDILFKAVLQTLNDVGETEYGGYLGGILVLHTWCQKLLFHPHLHCVIPGGVLTKENKWKPMKKDFFVHVNKLSTSFRKRFIELFEEAVVKGKITFPKDMQNLYNSGDFENYKNKLYKKDWYTYSKETFNGPQAVIEYLARYTHKVAITENRLKDYSDGNVTFKWRDNKDSGKTKDMKISGDEFVRRFLLHILPKGFMKIRYFGFMSNRHKKTKLKTCQIASGCNLNSESFRKKTKEEILLKMTKGKIFECPICKCNEFFMTGIEKKEKVGNTS